MKISTKKERGSNFEFRKKPEPFYEIYGSGENPIVLIHGFGLNRKSWYDIVPLLSEEHKIYAVDLIGFGDSPAPATWPYTIEAQAEILFNFIKAKNLCDIVLVGHSYGGSVTLMLLYKMMYLQMLSVMGV